MGWWGVGGVGGWVGEILLNIKKKFLQLEYIFSRFLSDHKKTVRFLDLFPRHKKTGKCSQCQQKTIKICQECLTIEFREKSICAMPSLRKPRFVSFQRRSSNSEIDKRWPGSKAEQKRKFKLLGFKKLIHIGPKIPPTSMKT